MIHGTFEHRSSIMIDPWRRNDYGYFKIGVLVMLVWTLFGKVSGHLSLWCFCPHLCGLSPLVVFGWKGQFRHQHSLNWAIHPLGGITALHSQNLSYPKKYCRGLDREVPGSTNYHVYIYIISSNQAI